MDVVGSQNGYEMMHLRHGRVLRRRQCTRCRQYKPLICYHKTKRICKICRRRSGIIRRNTERGQITEMISHARGKARLRFRKDPQRGRFTINRQFIIDQLCKQNYRCYYSNIPLSFEANCWRQASLERMDDRQGYTPENVVIICYALNIGLGRSFSRQKFQTLIKETPHPPMTREEFDRQLTEIKLFCSKVLLNARKNSKMRQLKRKHEDHSIDLTVQDLIDLVWYQRGLCAYSDIRMVFKSNTKDWMASLERLDPTRGYHVDNIAFICLELNSNRQLSREIVQSWSHLAR
jgi:hypothetical protein